VITASYRWAGGAEQFSELSDAARLQEAVDDLAALFDLDPSDVRRRVVGAVHKTWPDGFVVLNSESAVARQRTLNQPVVRGDGNLGLLFAGEHTCTTHGWMISAVQAALSAAHDILVGTR
jgi:monoamine oxidase